MGGLTFKNRGHLGSRYVYIYIFVYFVFEIFDRNKRISSDAPPQKQWQVKVSRDPLIQVLLQEGRTPTHHTIGVYNFGSVFLFIHHLYDLPIFDVFIIPSISLVVFLVVASWDSNLSQASAQAPCRCWQKLRQVWSLKTMLNGIRYVRFHLLIDL